jgi:hypothetical protein
LNDPGNDPGPPGVASAINYTPSTVSSTDAGCAAFASNPLVPGKLPGIQILVVPLLGMILVILPLQPMLIKMPLQPMLLGIMLGILNYNSETGADGAVGRDAALNALGIYAKNNIVNLR